MVGYTVFIRNGGERVDSCSHGSSSLSNLVVYVVFVEKDSRAGVAIFLTFPPRKYSDKKEKTWELFQKISHVF